MARDENTAADALSRVHPVREGSSSADANEAGIDLEIELPDIEIINAPGERELNTPIPLLENPTVIPETCPDSPSITPSEYTIDIPTPKSARESQSTPETPEDHQLYQEYYQWSSNRTDTRESEKPNASGKLWRRFSKRATSDTNTIILPPYAEKD